MWGELCNFVAEFFSYNVHMRFLGHIEAKTDVKGRVFFPAVFRKVLQASGEENLVLRKDIFQDCLVLYPESVWNEQMDRNLGRREGRGLEDEWRGVWKSLGKYHEQLVLNLYDNR